MFTAIPTSITIPITPIILIVVPVRKNNRIAPTTANGIVSRIVKGCSNDSNWEASTIYTRMTDRARANSRLFIDS